MELELNAAAAAAALGSPVPEEADSMSVPSPDVVSPAKKARTGHPLEALIAVLNAKYVALKKEVMCELTAMRNHSDDSETAHAIAGGIFTKEFIERHTADIEEVEAARVAVIRHKQAKKLPEPARKMVQAFVIAKESEWALPRPDIAKLRQRFDDGVATRVIAEYDRVFSVEAEAEEAEEAVVEAEGEAAEAAPKKRGGNRKRRRA